MSKTIFNRQVFISSTVLLLIGLFFAIAPAFEKFSTLEYNEFYIIIFGYLPTWGIGFSLSIKNLVSRNRKLFVLMSIALYCLLHYLTFIVRPTEILILTSLGGLILLIIFKFSESRIGLNFKDYFIVTLIGGTTFLPWGIENNLITVSLSVYLWQLGIGHYLSYAKLKIENI